MTERLNVTTETGESAVFSPGGEFTVQVKATHSRARFDVLGRVDTAADWEVLGVLAANEKFGRFADMPYVKIGVRRNVAGATAKAWTSV